MASSSWAILVLLLATSSALNVQFQESDDSVSEDDGFLELSVTMDNSRDTDVTVEIIPKTIQQYLASGGKLPGYVVNIDPAEEDLDYNSSTITVSLERGPRQTRMAEIEIFNDLLTETQEVFILELRIIDVNPPENRKNVFSNRNVTIVRIMPSRMDQTKIILIAEKSRFNESDGSIQDAVFIELDRAIESNITLQLSQTSSAGFQNVDDFRLPEEIIISSKTLRVNVPFEIIDDNIAEDDEIIVISILNKRRQLFNFETNSVNIFVKNNDIPKIGFSHNGTATSFLQVIEGESQDFCVSLLEPQLSQQFYYLRLSYSNSTSDFTLNDTAPVFVLFSPNNQRCFSIKTRDNNLENSNNNIIFNIDMLTIHSDILFEPSSLKIEFMDNDGAPMKPGAIFLNKTDSRLHISWTVEVSKYKPIEKFVVIASTVGSSTKVISRRQTHQTYQEYETNGTFYVLNIQETAFYIIQVCASNKDKRNCSNEVILKPTQNYTSKTEDIIFAPPTPVALLKREDGLGEMGVIAVIVGPCVAFALSILLILTVLICKFWGERRHYYPSHQEKILMASNLQMRHYYRQRSSTSSVSTDWTLASPSNCFTPSPKSTLQRNSTLGTPV